MEQTRNKREVESRESAQRPAKWMPPQLLPELNPEPGYVFRWIRVSMLNEDDPRNISAKLREGWEPVKASDHPEVRLYGPGSKNFPDSIEIGGLLACKTPTEFAEQRNAYYANQTETQMNSVDNSFMRESDPRMPVFNDRKSTVTFGKGF